jgi:preprotein translocase subunit SecE
VQKRKKNKQMKKFFENRLTDLKESYNELVHKVSWPTKSELANSTVLVMVASIIASLVIWVIDLAINEVMKVVYHVAA